MLASSRDIKRRLEREGGFSIASEARIMCTEILEPARSSCFRTPGRIWESASYVPFTGRQAGDLTRKSRCLTIAIIEDGGPDKAVGVWFPDLPGCFSAGGTLDEAILNAPEAVALYAEALETDGRPLPPPRPLSVLRNDPTFVSNARDHMVALISVPEHLPSAAE